ncbi:hypothetical protein PENVUL_c059G01980 [Penicillium vulpinum]|uniref:Uncharacterized protein n=1 Tax=Penicillium vulpinum TaxID=29845 RepID=A0A1V6RE54_9EURO|nr:hypothetical protein PENVUL_c059G01980 [Penicillium vulpinum]
MSSHRVQPSTRPLEFCPNCASYLTILPRATDPVHGFQNYFTCRACLYICLVSESESCEDESCSDETADDETADGETAGDETTDDEAVDDEAVDDEAVDDESPVDPLKSYIHTAVQEMQDIQDGQVTSLLADTKFPSQALMHPKQDEGVYLSNIPLGRVVQYMITKVLETNSQKRRYQDFVNNPVVRCQLIGPNELIKIGGDPESDPNAGVYLHILLIPGLMYLYTGHPSLHYKIWEWLEETGELTSVFVKVAGFKQKLRGELDQLLLNLLEMFIACVFQTLRSSDLEFYLPDEVEICWGGRGLNVALPIWQGYTLRGEEIPS